MLSKPLVDSKGHLVTISYNFIKKKKKLFKIFEDGLFEKVVV